MIKVSVFYPNTDGGTFDMAYYCSKHMPMVREKLGTACKSAAVEQGLGGGIPGSPPIYRATGHLYFESVESFQNAFGPHAASIRADLPNYTNITPVIQISEVKM